MNTGMPAAYLGVHVQAQGIARTNSELMKTHGSLERTAKAGQRLGRGLETSLKVGAAGAAVALGAAVKVGMDFERQIDSLGAVTGASGKQMAVLENQALKLGESTAFTAREVGAAQTELAKGGLSIEQIYGGGVQAALSLAAAGEMELAESGETTVNSMKLFNLGGGEAIQVADMLATAANRTTADVVDFAMALKQGGSVTRLAGYDMNETVTVLEALAEAGIKNSDAGTSMKTSVIQLLKPTEKQEKLARLLGISWETQAGTLKSAAGLSRELRSATDDMTKSERAKTFATLAGTDGVRTLNALYAATPKELRALERANAQQGTAQDVARKKMDNYQGTLEELQGSAETLGIRVYQSLKPSLEAATVAAGDLVGEVSEIFADGNLSNEQKFLKSLDLVTDAAADAAEAAIPALIEYSVRAAAQGGPKIAMALVRGIAGAFWDMNGLGKVLSLAVLIRVLGGRGALAATGKAIGRMLGLGVVEGMATTTAAGAPAAMAATAAAGARSTVVAPIPWSPASPALGSGAARQAAATATSRALLEESFGGFTLAAASASRVAGEKSGTGFLRSWTTRVKGAAPSILPAVSSVGANFARGLSTYGLGGLLVGGMTKEIVGGDTGQKIGSALEGAGVGAAIGTAIAPGIGTAIGAVIGGGAGIIAGEVGRSAMGEKIVGQMGQEIEARFGPRLKKAFSTKDVGNLASLSRQLRGAIKVAISEGAGPGVVMALRARLQQALDARNLIQGPREAVLKEIGTLRSGLATRLSDINQIFRSNIGQINQGWTVGSGRWRKITVQNMDSAVAAIRAGMRQGVIETDVGQQRIKDLIRGMRLVEGRDPYGIAEGFASSWKQAGQINNSKIDSMLHEMQRMPKGSREAAQDAMIQMAKALENKGELVKGSASRLQSALVTKFGKTNKQLVKGVVGAGEGIAGVFASLVDSVSGYLGNLGENVNAILKAFGVNKAVNFTVKAAKGAASIARGAANAAGSVVDTITGKQTGGFIVPGHGSGDRPGFAGEVGAFVLNREATRAYGFNRGGMVPLALEPGERYFTRNEVRAMGGANTLESLNRSVPRFQNGGEIGGRPQVAGPAGPLRDLGQAAVTKPYEAAREYIAKHKPQAGLAGLGNAPADLREAMALAQSKGLTITSTTGGTHAENSWHYKGRAFDASNGTSTPQEREYAIAAASKWGRKILELFFDPLGWYIKNGQKISGSIGDHSDHVHTAMQLGGWIQALVDGGFVGNINRIYAEHNSASGDWGGTKLPEYVIAALAEAAGAPGVTMQQMTVGESGGRPGATGVDPGGTKGLGLWMITTGFNDALIAKYGGQGAMRNPVRNAAAMAEIYRSQGLGAWYGDDAVTGSSLHYEGSYDLSRALGGKTYQQALGGGAAGLTEGQKQAAEGKQRKANYEKRLQVLQQEANQAKSVPAQQSKLWKLVKFWGRVGMFDKDERGHILDAVQSAAAQTKPQGAVNVLRSLTDYAKGHGEITGQDPSNFRGMEEAIQRAQDRGQEQRQKAVERQKKHVEGIHKRVEGKIANRAAFPQWVDRLSGLRHGADIGEEFASQLVALEPETVGDGYVDQERGAYSNQLNQLLGWRNTTVNAQEYATAEIARFEQQIAAIEALNIGVEPGMAAPAGKQAKGKALGGLVEYLSNGGKAGIGKAVRADGGKASQGSPANTYAQYEKVAYKIPLLEQAIADAKTMRDETWAGELEEIQGLSGPKGILDSLPSEPTAGAFGGRIFEIQNSIRELALKVGNATSGVSELKELEAQLNTDWHKRFLVSEAQRNTIADFNASYPMGSFAGMFATGGNIRAGQWGIAGENGEEAVVHGPARVFNPAETDALLADRSAPPIVIEELNVHPDGRVTARYDKREIEILVKKVIRDGSVTGRPTSGGRSL